jgi:hypothetical protein
MLCARMRQLLASNFRLNAGSPEWSISWFSTVPPCKYLPRFTSRPLTNKLFVSHAIHHSAARVVEHRHRDDELSGIIQPEVSAPWLDMILSQFYPPLLRATLVRLQPDPDLSLHTSSPVADAPLSQFQPPPILIAIVPNIILMLRFHLSHSSYMPDPSS